MLIYWVYLLLWISIVSSQRNQSLKLRSPYYSVLPLNVTNTLSWQQHKPSWKNFKVAVLTAGEIRSFAFTARSWERYLLEPWTENVHLFAFVSAQPHCPLDEKGVEKLRELATSYEVSYTKTLYLDRSRHGHVLVQSSICGSLKQAIHKVKKGNVFDMYERRYRAYRLAMHYSEEKAFQWDLFLFTRTDIAYYSPIVPLYTYYTHLLHNKIENQVRGIIIPYMCRFNGICDRHAVGLSEEMAIYFERDWLMRLVHLYDSNTTMGAQLRASLRCPHISEQLPALWLQMHNITAMETVPRTIAFFTLRSDKGWEYCHSTRDHVQSSTNFSWVDRTTIAVVDKPPRTMEDDEINGLKRCGSIVRSSWTDLCSTPKCDCFKQ